MTATVLDTHEDLIDVRDIIKRFEFLEGTEDADELTELGELKATLDDLKGRGGDEQWRGDWYPVTLVRETYFDEYMDEMLEDCGELPKDLPSYLTITVDYKALQMDYTSTEIGTGDQQRGGSVTYYYR